MEQPAEWNRGYVLLVAGMAAAFIALAVFSSFLPRHPDGNLPSCFDEVAKLRAQPGDRCNPVH